MEYVNSNNLIGNSICSYDNTTIKNIILLSLLTGMRIGELGALDYNNDIDFINSCFKVHRSLTKDKQGKIKMGKYTKTGKHKVKHGEIDNRDVPFNIFDKDLVITLLKEQIKVAQTIPNNKENLLFCRKDGKYLNAHSITNIFKRICRNAEIKLQLANGCHIYMCRHTVITRMIEAEIDLILITKIVGHTSIDQIEKTYGHIFDKFKQKQLIQSQELYSQNNMLTLKMKNILNTKDA